MGDPTDWAQSLRLQRRSRNLVSAFCLVLVSLTGCEHKDSGIDVDLVGVGRTRIATSETLRVNLATEPPSLDWQKSSDTTSSNVLENIMQGLTRYDFSTPALSLRPGLALKWVPLENGRIWKITLRENVKWSDGVPFTPQHVVDGWHRLLARETGADNAYALFGVKNAQAFNKGEKPWDDVGVKVTGVNELTVELEHPLAYFPYLLAHHTSFPARLDVIAKYGDRWTDPAHVVTLGPYQLKAWSHDRLMVLERNPLYYGNPAPVRYIAVYMINEQATAINLFDSGRLDAVHALPSIEIKRQSKRAEYHETALLRTAFYGMNVTKPPMDNVLVRRAIAHAIDRRELTQMLAGGQRPLQGWIPPGMFGFEEDVGLKFDPVEARALLKKAGLDPAIAATIEIKFNTNEDWSRVAENIQAQLKRNLGLRVELKNEEWKVFLNSLHSNPPQMYRMGWAADYPDPDTFMRLMTSVSENNYSRWKNPNYDKLVGEAATSVDATARRDFYKRASKILTEEDVPVLPLFVGVDHALVGARVQNYPLNAMGAFDYEEVSFK